MKHGAHIHVDANDLDCSDIMVQQVQDEDTHVVSIMGRELSKGEQCSTLFERLLLCACWAVKCQFCYVLYLPELTIVMPHVEQTICA